jgi:hypothetical protein
VAETVAALSPRRRGFDSGLVRVRLMVDTMLWDRFFSEYLVFPCQYQSTNAPYSSSPTCCSYGEDKRVKLGNLPYSNALSEIGGGGPWMVNYNHI